jgi:hypothetical protein
MTAEARPLPNRAAGRLRKWLWFMAKVGCGAVVLVLIAVVMLQWMISPPLWYVARGARPIITALTAYRDAKGRFPAPADVNDLTLYFPAGTTIPLSTATIGQWEYTTNPADGKSYRLGCRVSHDAWLYYDFDGGKGTWAYEDGGVVTNVSLSP